MKYKLYRLKFNMAVHFGNGRLSSTDICFYADRMFSAMCLEACKLYGTDGIDKLVIAARQNSICLSDAMPYIDDTYYIPKPIIHIEAESDSTVKKAFKKLPYIPSDMIGQFLNGELDAKSEADKFSQLGKKAEKCSAVIRSEDNTVPYRIGVYEFKNNCGLYFILGYEDEEYFDMVDSLIYSLQYNGIGGKISSGLGKFDTTITELPEQIAVRMSGEYKRYVSLSICMAKDDELERVIRGADYSMIKRSGFINSKDYADTQMKKKNMYCFASGSCFDERFEGDIFNVAGNGKHPVYRYAKPMFMGVI